MSGRKYAFEAEIIPVEIRPGEFVQIYGIPYDLTEQEADKIARVVKAYATGTAPDRRALKEAGE